MKNAPGTRAVVAEKPRTVQPRCNLHKPLTRQLRLTSSYAWHSRAERCRPPGQRPLGLRLASDIHWGVVFFAAIHPGLGRPAHLLRERVRGTQAAVAGKAKTALRSEARTNQARSASRSSAIAWLGGQVYGYEHATWRWQQLMGVRRTPTEGRVLSEMSSLTPERGAALAAARDGGAAGSASIRLTSGSSSASTTTRGAGRTPASPYYGGLQMDRGFQREYGGSAPADEGDGRPLDAPRADLDGGESAQEQGVLALAEHREVLRAALAHHATSSHDLTMTSS